LVPKSIAGQPHKIIKRGNKNIPQKFFSFCFALFHFHFRLRTRYAIANKPAIANTNSNPGSSGVAVGADVVVGTGLGFGLGIEVGVCAGLVVTVDGGLAVSVGDGRGLEGIGVWVGVGLGDTVVDGLGVKEDGERPRETVIALSPTTGKGPIVLPSTVANTVPTTEYSASATSFGMLTLYTTVLSAVCAPPQSQLVPRPGVPPALSTEVTVQPAGTSSSSTGPYTVPVMFTSTDMVIVSPGAMGVAEMVLEAAMVPCAAIGNIEANSRHNNATPTEIFLPFIFSASLIQKQYAIFAIILITRP